ncbi:LOW QUALITY PROTEIN: hypothetical protein MXB_2505 [Myxobolus squamalis]|nr:LOW QUALITY PROTEIN: hypothetical protein MXB_2505 [Myxobolus squamalis]
MVLYKILKKRRQKDRSIRVLILGLDNAGKTSIIECIKGNDISKCSPTLGFKINTLKYKEYQLNLICVVHYWDVGGQKNFRSYWKNYFEETDGIIWVVDSSDPTRIELCKQELEILLHEEYIGKLIGATLLVFANKQDLKNCLSKTQISKVLVIYIPPLPNF